MEKGKGKWVTLLLVGVSAKWSYVTASLSHHDQGIPILSPLLFMHVGHPYITLFKIPRIYLYITSLFHVLYVPVFYIAIWFACCSFTSFTTKLNVILSVCGYRALS